MEEGIYGFQYEETIGNEEFEQVFRHEQLGISVINTYVRYIRSTLLY